MHCHKCGNTNNFDLVRCVHQRVLKVSPSQVERWEDEKEKFGGLFLCSHCHESSFILFSRKTPPNNGAQLHPVIAADYHMLMGYLNRLTLISYPRTGIGKTVLSEVQTDSTGDNLRITFDIQSIYPESEDSIPAYLPPSIHKMYAEDLLQVTGSPRHSVIACRALIEAACKDKLGVTNKRLVDLIADLGDQGIITKDLTTMAHNIRSIGNDAVHDSDPISREESKELIDFTKLLLEIIYTYPERVKQLKSKP